MFADAPLDHEPDPIEKASRDEIAALQVKRLRWPLTHAYDNVPQYKRKVDSAGAHPDDLKSLDDLKKFPFTTKQDLRDTYPFGMFAVPRERVVRIHASSGTTGKSTVVGYTRADIETWADLMARSIRASGGRPGDKVHVAYGYGLFTGGLGAHYGAERLGCTVIPFGGGQTERQIQLILDFEPDLIMVTPSYLLNIADEFERQGHDPQDRSLRMGELIDDLLTLSQIACVDMKIPPVDLSAIATEIVRELRRTEPKRQVDIIVAADVSALGDPRLLRLALENLLGNAWKFTAHRDGARIEFGVENAGSAPVYFVRDNGAGFDMAYAQKLFEPFERLHGVQEFPGGGIGLAIVKRIVDRHGGRVWAEAAPGVGATLRFTLG